MPRYRKPAFPFGERLVTIRKAQGISQTELARRIGSTQRSISYYELQADYPPGEAIIALAKGLGVSADELLGIKSLKEKPKRNRQEQWLWKKFRKILSLPDRDQRAIVRTVNLAVSASRTGSR